MSTHQAIVGNPSAQDGRSLRVVEVFGPTIQGEGPAAGRVAVFVRLADCNHACGPCDTRYSWDWQTYDRAAETRDVAPAVLISWVLAQSPQMVVLTGGEPLLQQDALTPVVGAVVAAGRLVDVETNGTLPPHPRLAEPVNRFVVSPKLSSMFDTAPARRIKPGVLRAFMATGKAVFKFVVAERSDVEEVVALQRTYGLSPIWVMPQATSPEAVLTGMRALAEPALEYGWNLSPRLHVLLWGDQRGR